MIKIDKGQSMLIDDIFKRKDALLYLERYANKGSPSGFTNKYAVSKRYHPIHPSPFFELPVIKVPLKDCLIFPEFAKTSFIMDDCILFPVHPDMIEKVLHVFDSENYNYTIDKPLKAVPTASMRTVYVRYQGSEYYLKLHYDGVIGRINRKLPYFKAIAGVEISQYLEKYQEKLPASLAFFREFCAISNKTDDENRQIGFIIRDSKPFPYVSDDRILIPFFALTSRDIFNNDDPLLLVQIINKHKSLDNIFRKIVELILKSYFYLIFSHGLIPEINAQNILLELDRNFNPTRIVLRDLIGWEKDLSLRNSLGLENNFKSYPYKCISKKDGILYYIRHSFSYDFKLSFYVIDDIVNNIVYEFGLNKGLLVDLVKDSFDHFVRENGKKYFNPTERWYSHPKCLLTQFRPYIEHLYPKYRRVNMVSDKNKNFLNVIYPPALKQGDFIGIVAPSEPIIEERWKKLQEGIKLFESLGFKVKIAQNIRKIEYYMAGSAYDRASDFNEMINDKDVKVIWTAWGGKSANQILDLIDWKSLSLNPKIIVGFSDTTNVINAAFAKCNLVAFHGPHVAGKIASCPKESINNFINAFMYGKVKTLLSSKDMQILRKGHCVGRLIGGNLKSFVLSNLNTPYDPNIEGAIFFWETGSGTPQEIDQYLTYLHLAGFFHKISGMIVGDLSNCKDKRDWGGRNIYDVVKSCTENYSFPIIHINTFGHGNITNLTIPVGCKAKIDTEANLFEIIELCVDIKGNK